MTLNRQDGLAVHVRESAETFLRTHCPQLRNSLPEAPFAVAPEAGALAGYLLAWTAPLAFCSGLVSLAVSSPFDVAVPRWLILVCGVGCALLALLARPWQQSPPPGALGVRHGRKSTDQATLMTLWVLTGDPRGQKLTLRDLTCCVLGRARTCQLRLPGYPTVSRQRRQPPGRWASSCLPTRPRQLTGEDH
jgi:hypothetical protein